MHSVEIVHRDVNGNNILYDGERAHLIDYSAAIIVTGVALSPIDRWPAVCVHLWNGVGMNPASLVGDDSMDTCWMFKEPERLRTVPRTVEACASPKGDIWALGFILLGSFLRMKGLEHREILRPLACADGYI